MSGRGQNTPSSEVQPPHRGPRSLVNHRPESAELCTAHPSDMQIQPAVAHQHHLPHPITVVTGRRRPVELDLTKAQQSGRQHALHNYPSPPMSSPPSPPRTFFATSGVQDSRQQPAYDPRGAPPPAPSHSRPEVPSISREANTAPIATLPLPTSTTFQPSFYSGSPRLPTSVQPTLAERNYFPQRAAVPLTNQPAAVQISEIGRVAGPLRSGRSNRRGKTHVQKACVNCKKAHLSCDAQRPCARCVSSGRQVSAPESHCMKLEPRLTLNTHRTPATMSNTRSGEGHGFATTAMPKQVAR